MENGAMVAKFSVATNESYRDKNGEWQDQTEWHDVVVWRTLAERAEANLKKGTLVYIEGKLTHRKYQDQEGKDRKITEVVASYFRVLTRRDGSGGGSNYIPSADDEPQFGNNFSEPSTQSSGSESFPEAADDDLPF